MCERSWSGRFNAISALTVTRLRSRLESPGRSQTSPNRTLSVKSASLGAISPISCCARDGCDAAPAEPAAAASVRGDREHASGQQATARDVAAKRVMGCLLESMVAKFDLLVLARSIQTLLRQELRDPIRDLDIVQVRERKVRIAANADLRQMNERDLTAVLVDASRQSRAISNRARQLSCAGIGIGCAGMLSP